MKKNALALLIPLLITSCGQNSNRVENKTTNPSFDQFTASAIAEVGQEATSNESGLYSGSNFNNLNINCLFDNLKTTRTVVKVDIDDIFVYEVKEFNSKKESSDESCPESLSVEKKLIKRTHAGEIRQLKELANGETSECKRDCTSSPSLEGDKIAYNYSGVYEFEKREVQLSGKIIPNLESPWLTQFVNIKQSITPIGGNDTIIMKQDFKLSQNLNTDLISIDFDSYELEIYDSLAIDITEETMGKLAGKNYIQGNDHREVISISNDLEDKTMTVEKERTLITGQKCITQKIATISKIEEKSDQARRLRLDEDILTIALTDQKTILDTEKTDVESHALCKDAFDKDRDPTTIHKFIKIDENGSLIIDITRTETGRIFNQQ